MTDVPPRERRRVRNGAQPDERPDLPAQGVLT